MISSKELFQEISNQCVCEGGEVVGYFVKNSRMNLLENLLSAPAVQAGQEPIYQLRDVDWYDTDKRTYDTVVNTGGAGRIVYAAPQLPQPAPVAVPDEMEMDDDFDSAFEHGKAVGWNACRAAMLKAGPVTAAAVSDGWRESLQELVKAMRDYEMDVGEPAPYKHRAMMKRAEALLASHRAAMLHGAEPVQEQHESAGHAINCRSDEKVQVVQDGQPVSQPYTLPDGYALVPVEPTIAMLDEFDSIIDYGADDSNDAWRRLLAAAWIKSLPAAPQQEANNA
ncbi:hypothetical protein [Atlantibacter hermannii]|uniref:hypothetical protein n=1 Tax=Atlantibacter hermannii TaxID=565 RepID=UPI0028B23842|nr:hypothetical protein [Atlantibacter hermannii]